MYDTVRATGYAAVFYYVALILMGNVILLNLFLAILLGNFDQEIDEKRKEKKL